MAGLIVLRPGGGEELVAYSEGDGPIYDAPRAWFSAGFLLNPPYPFRVSFPKPSGTDFDIPGIIIRCPTQPERIWKLTGRPCQEGEHRQLGFFEATWPD